MSPKSVGEWVVGAGSADRAGRVARGRGEGAKSAGCRRGVGDGLGARCRSIGVHKPEAICVTVMTREADDAALAAEHLSRAAAGAGVVLVCSAATLGESPSHGATQAGHGPAGGVVQVGGEGLPGAVIFAVDSRDDAKRLRRAALRFEEAGVPVLLMALGEGTGGERDVAAELIVRQIGSTGGVDGAVSLGGVVNLRPPTGEPAATGCARGPWTLAVGAVAAAVRRQIRVVHAQRELALEQALKAQAQRQLAEHDHEIDMAKALQRATLPRGLADRLPPAPAGIDGRPEGELSVAALFRPASALSGDLYDVVRLDEHRVGLFLADACGHGMPAALLAMLIAKLLPTHDGAGEEARVVSPGEAMARLNREFIRRRPDEASMFTAVYAVADVRDGSLVIASAGHPPASVAAVGGLRRLNDGGPAMGVFDDAEFPEIRMDLAPGETLLMFSDGFEQAFAAHGADLAARRRGNERYLDAFARAFDPAGPADLTEAFTSLQTALDGEPGSLHQQDDLTLLALRRAAPAASLEVPRRLAA